MSVSPPMSVQRMIQKTVPRMRNGKHVGPPRFARKLVHTRKVHAQRITKFVCQNVTVKLDLSERRRVVNVSRKVNVPIKTLYALLTKFGKIVVFTKCANLSVAVDYFDVPKQAKEKFAFQNVNVQKDTSEKSKAGNAFPN